MKTFFKIVEGIDMILACYYAWHGDMVRATFFIANAIYLAIPIEE